MQDPKKLVEELNFFMFENFWNKNHILTPETYLRMNHIAARLSSLLPEVSDATIFEIDDIIYGDDDSDVVAGTNLTSEENLSYLVERCFGSILEIFVERNIDCSRIVEMVFLQLLELMSKRTFSYSYGIGGFNQIWEKIKCSALSLKVVKIMVNGDVVITFKKFVTEFVDKLWLNIFEKNADFDNVHDKRRAVWLSEQSEFILKRLNVKKFDCAVTNHFETYQLENDAHYDWLFISILMCHKDKFNADFSNNHLHNYFSSARCHEEKMQRIQDFIRGICQDLFITWGKTIVEHRFTKYSKFIVDGILNLFRDIDKYPSTYMMKLQRYHKYDIGTYLSRDNYCSAYLTFKEEIVELVEKYFGSLNYFDDESDTSEESFWDGEKVSFFHKFMKGLQLLEILHTTWLMVDDVEEFKDVHPGFVTEIFRPNDSPIKLRISEFITDPSKRGRVDWWIPFLLMKCPFLIQSYQCESHMKNLIKLLKGKNIDKAIEEALLYMTH